MIMSLVYLKNKKNGTTYVYESENYWDKGKKQSRSNRICIGKLDENGELIPSKRLKKQPQVSVKRGPVPFENVKHRFYGATYLFDAIGDKLNITSDLKACFPDSYQQILSMAYFLILEESNSLSRFPKWERLHIHPYGKDIPSQRSSEVFASISEESRYHFFRLQGKRRADNEFWAYDTTSISSYSNTLKQVKYGKNKDGDQLPQINLALLYGETSNLPFYYRKLPGNIPDVKTLTNLLADMNNMGFEKIKLVMDRGFYSKANINSLYKEHLKFLISTKISLVYIQKELNKVREEMCTRKYYHSGYRVYACTKIIQWDYSQDRPYKGDTLNGKRRLYLHFYFNREKAVESENKLNARLDRLEEELISGKRVPEHEKLYAKYFNVHTTPVKGTKVTYKEDAIAKAEKDYGYFTLISNTITDPIEALEIYRNKDVVEKAFGNLKDRLNMRRTLVSSESSLEGKLFVQFVALIFLSYIKKQMQEHDLYRSYTLQSLLDELDVIESFEFPNHVRRLGEITKKQESLFNTLGVPPPTTL
jgi:transposase